MKNYAIVLHRAIKEYYTGNNKVFALTGLDLKIASGEFLSIMGPSGSGKSTLLNVMGLLDRLNSGEYYFNGINTQNINENELARIRSRKIGFVFQSFNLISTRTAIENVALPLYYQDIPKTERLREAGKLLDRVGLSDKSLYKPDQLSGGQKQRIAIARALICNPDLILADEPTGALDSVTSNEIMELFQEINNSGKTIVVVTHEHDIAKKTKRKITLKDGNIMDDSSILSKTILMSQ